MSTSGFGGSGLSQLESAVQSAEQFLKDFQQLGKDLKGGKLEAAKQDFVTLSQDARNAPDYSINNAANDNALSAMEAGFQNLSQGLQRGDLGAAEQAYAQIVKASDASAALTGQAGGDLAVLQILHQLAGIGPEPAAATAQDGTPLVSTLRASKLAESTESASADQEAKEAELGQPPQLGYGTIGALAAVLKNLGAALGSGDLNTAQSAFAQFVREMQSGSEAGTIHGSWVKSFLEAQGSSGGIAQNNASQVNLSV